MADDDGNNYYDDDWDEDFEDYVPSTVDARPWVFIATCLFCVCLVVMVSYLLWRTQKRRKALETERTNALILPVEPTSRPDKDSAEGEIVKKASDGTAETDGVENDDDSDCSSVDTAIEDDSESVTSTTVPIVDHVFSCVDQDYQGSTSAAPPIVKKKNQNRFLRGRAKKMKHFFRTETSNRQAPPPNQGGVRRSDGSRVLFIDTSASGSTNVGYEMRDGLMKDATASDYQQMDEQMDASTPSHPSIPVANLSSTTTKDKSSSQDQVPKHSKRASVPRFLSFMSRRSTKETTPPADEDGILAYSQVKDEVTSVSSQSHTASFISKEEPDHTQDYHELDESQTNAPTESEPSAPGADVDTAKHETVSPEGPSEGIGSADTGAPVLPKTDATAPPPIDQFDMWNPREIKSRRRCFKLCFKSFRRKIRRVGEYENEMKKILKLAIPYTLTALFSCISDIVTVAIIGKLLGTRELSALISVEFALSVTTLWIEGPLDCLSIVCSQAMGMGEKKLAGQYLQIAVVITQILYLPQVLLWLYFMDDFILWLGFDEETAQIGYDYAIVLLINELFSIMYEGLHYFLEVCDHEDFSAITSISQEIVGLVTVLSVALTSNPSLQTIGIIHFVLDVVFFIISLAIINWKGWFKDYWPGITGSFAFANIGAVKHLLRTAVPLSIAHILSGGEWEILFVFASFLGPAEVVAWGIFGALWEGIETVTTAMADAGEVRCAYLLGADYPMRAKHSAQKSMLLGFLEGFIIVAFLAASGHYLPEWLTNDLTLQGMLRDLMGILCVGILFDTVGSVSFSLLCAQGSIVLATVSYFIGSWVLTLPLAFVSSYVLNLDLEAMAAAVVVGNTLSGMINTYFLLDSDWYYFAAITHKGNEGEVVWA